ncbi:GNAT family N-acetyltransferase [Sedimenticola sp.]|uniref:GNAT family N-acetyltransferase n=1 Tax=Sedimenticola sp. TaxID=1940285 RepID=UPI003D0B86F0
MIEISQEHGNISSVLCNIYNTARANAGCYPDKDISLIEFNELIKGEEIYTALIEGNIVGFIGVYSREFFIHHLYVMPAYQSKGAGKQLLGYSYKKYGQPLTLKCDHCNLAALGFYRAMGLVSISEGVGDFGAWTEFRLEWQIADA